jgi:purine-binding chemotaxis protein CheW
MAIDKQYLVFSLHGALYGIGADCVREVCGLPELHLLPTAPADILGIFNWRSQMVPVMHLDLRFGRGFDGCNVNDRAIVVANGDTHVAIIAHEVYDVRNLAAIPLDESLIYSRQSTLDRNFISGIAQATDAPVTCLDLDRLIREPVSLEEREPQLPLDGAADFYSRYCPQATVAERAVFASRAAQLKISMLQQEQQRQTETGLLAVQIGTQYLSFPLELVVDVDDLSRFSLNFVPGVPAYILGQINWRGAILPVLEIGSKLQLPPLPRQEIVVVKLGEIEVGIAVDRIFDVFYLSTDRIEPLPLSNHDKLHAYVSGTAKYADGLMYMLKLQELIEGEFLPDRLATTSSA